MTLEEKIKVQKMRLNKKSYSQIAESLKVSENTVKSFCRRNCLQISEEIEILENCKNCGTSLINIEKHKPKKFCSDNCRLNWWKNNKDQIKKKAIYIIKCSNCGLKFESYGNSKRKFCSHKCYIDSRFKK